MDEVTEQHDAQTRDSIWQIACALAHLWLTSAYLKIHRLPTPSVYYLYDDSFGQGGWGREILTGKRIKVTIEIEEWTG